MTKGRVYWITGLPGSGKTTIGTSLYYELKKQIDNVVILDGDILKLFVGDSVGYTNQDRLLRAKKYSNICKMLADQGIWVIICTVAMFDEVRQWNRNNIDGYMEIFLDISLEILKERDKKGLYSAGKGMELVQNSEFPKLPDITISEKADIKKDIKKIIEYVPENISKFDRDTNYWNKIYNQETTVPIESDFARYVLKNTLDVKGNLLELGCGNGRDSIFFATNGFKVIGVDASEEAISSLNKKNNINATFVCDDFVKCKALYCIMYDVIYSRFTLHAISEKQETELLNNIISGLKTKGRLFIEARSINDDLYGKGECVEEGAYVYNNHYRRFIDKEKLCNKMSGMGFKILEANEGRGFSRVGYEDPVLVRIVAEVK